MTRSGEQRPWQFDLSNNPRVKVRDVEHFLETLRNVAVLLPEYAAHAAYGAVAYLKADEAADAYAERQGCS